MSDNNEINGENLSYSFSEQDLADLQALIPKERDNIDIACKVVGGIAGFCVGGVVSKLVRTYTPPGGRFTNAQIRIGGAVLGSYVGAKSELYVRAETRKLIEGIRDAWTTVVDEVN